MIPGAKLPAKGEAGTAVRRSEKSFRLTPAPPETRTSTPERRKQLQILISFSNL